jgi:hypothetical protein
MTRPKGFWYRLIFGKKGDTPRDRPDTPPVTHFSQPPWQDRGNGIVVFQYYRLKFDENGKEVGREDFPTRLAQFIEAHPELEVVSMVGKVWRGDTTYVIVLTRARP